MSIDMGENLKIQQRLMSAIESKKAIHMLISTELNVVDLHKKLKEI